MKSILVFLLTIGIFANADSKNADSKEDLQKLNPKDMQELSRQAVKGMASCNLKAVSFDATKFSNKTDQSIDKTEFAKILEKEISSANIPLIAGMSSAPLEATLTSIVSQSKKKYKAAYSLKLEASSSDGTCHATGDLIKSTTVK